MDINNFKRTTTKQILQILSGISKPSKELLDIINSELSEKITFAQLTDVLVNLQDYYDITKELFDREDGFISKITFDGKFPKEMRMSNKIFNLASEFGRIANESRTLKPSLKAIEEKDEFNKLYQKVKSYDVGEHITAEFSEQVLSGLEKISNVLEKETGEDFKDRKAVDFQFLTALKRSLTEISAVPTEMREEYYSYWRKKHGLFNRLSGVIENSFENLLETGKFESDVEPEVKEGEIYEQLSDLTEKNVLPSYILKFSPIVAREYPESTKTIMLLKDFLDTVGREVPRKYKNLLPNEEIVSQMGIIVDYDPISGDLVQSVDANLDAELEEALEQLDALKEDINIDPLFSILIKNRKVPYAINQRILDQTLEIIRKELDLSGLNDFQEDIQELLDNEINTFIDSYKDTYSVDDSEYYMPMMDSTSVMSHFNKFKNLTITVSYIKKGIIKEITFTKYSDAVEFVNKNTINFLCNLIDILEIDLRSAPMLEKPSSGARDLPGTKYFRGGDVIPRPTKSPKAAEDKVEAYKEILDSIVDYYIDPLSGSMILLEDTPEFFSHKCFRDLPIILTKNPIVLAETAMLEGIEPIADKNDYNKITELLQELENPDDVVYNDKLVNLFEDALDSYVKFWTLVAVKTNKDEFSLKDILTDAKIVLGDTLYEIAKITESKETLDKELFRDEPLSFWNQEQEKKKVSIKGLLPLLGQKTWKTYVTNQNNRERGTKAAYDRLLRLLKESDLKLAGELTTAMLEATDILRKMEGLTVYNAQKDITDIDDLEYVINKIRKEHNIDLYGVDIYNIVKSQSSFNDIGNTFGLSSEIIYKIKGMFR